MKKIDPKTWKLSEDTIKELDRMQRYTLEALRVHSEIVRIIGESEQQSSSGKFYWTLSFDDMAMVDMEIIFTAHNDRLMLELYEVQPKDQASKSINYDVIYTLIGYACSSQIELKHNAYLHIPGKKS